MSALLASRSSSTHPTNAARPEAAAKAGNDTLIPASPSWPVLDHRALQGVIRDIVQASCAFSEADPVAVAVGFTVCWSNGGLALLHYGPHGIHCGPAFLLQNFYVKEFAENLQMHLLVKDVDAWWEQLQAKQISQKYGVGIGKPEDRDWKMRDFTLFDPSGVLWRIAQDID